MQARDERAVCEAERASSRGGKGDGQPVQRSKPRVGHGAEAVPLRFRVCLLGITTDGFCAKKLQSDVLLGKALFGFKNLANRFRQVR